MPTHLVWFRADLRIHDNFALAAACRAKDANVLALFIATPEQWRQHDMAPRQAALLSAYLNDLQHSLAEKGIPLIYKEAHDFAAQLEMVQAICKQHAVTP
ncbi:deoxyribodipyrimidine photo-lyase, partial [Escherichia coli]|nr:deoxyribodipyrimidine photo-lyase [Escherichia coli]